MFLENVLDHLRGAVFLYKPYILLSGQDGVQTTRDNEQMIEQDVGQTSDSGDREMADDVEEMTAVENVIPCASVVGEVLQQILCQDQASD